MMAGSSREHNRKCPRVGKQSTALEEREDKSDRYQPKILAGSIRLPQVFGYTNGHKELARMSYNFKYTVNDLGLDRNKEKIEINDVLFLNVIKRPRVYSKIETIGVGNRTSTVESTIERESVRTKQHGQVRERTSKSCPKPINFDKPVSKYIRFK